MFVRKKCIPGRGQRGARKEYSYYYLVENYWEQGKTRQRDIAYLGKEPMITPQRIEALGLNREALESVRGLWIEGNQKGGLADSKIRSQESQWKKAA